MANNLMSGDLKALRAKWNATLGVANSAKQCIEGNSFIADIAQSFTNYYDSNFYDTSSNILFKDSFNLRIMLSVPRQKNCQSMYFTVNDIRFAINKLKKR